MASINTTGALVAGSNLAGGLEQWGVPATILRNSSRREQAAEAAREFEALLLGKLLQMVREAAQSEEEKEGIAAGGATYLEIAEQQLARALAAGGGFGIGRLIQGGLEGLGRPRAVDSAPLADKD